MRGTAMELLDRQLLFVTGKGGVGKTSVAAALGQLGGPPRASERWCARWTPRARWPPPSTTPTLEFEPRRLDADLFGMAMNTEDSLREYLRLFVRVPLLGRIGPLARTFDFVADAAPGVKEILAVGKLAYEVRERHYDLVIVDAEATGHIVAQVAAPRVISELVQVGMVRDQTRWMLDILEDPARTGLVVVTTPEEMPVTETIDLLGRLGRETGVAPTRRRREPRPAGAVRSTPVRRGRAARARSRTVLVEAAGPGVRQVVRRRPADRGPPARRRRAPRTAPRRASRQGLPVLYVPELFTRATGRRVVVARRRGARPRNWTWRRERPG